MKLRELQIRGYKSLYDVKLPLRDLAVLIGANGSGKTAFLEVLYLLKRGAEQHLSDEFNQLGGVDVILSQTSDGRVEELGIRLSSDVESNVSQAPLIYQFELRPRGTGYVFPHERLEWQRDRGTRKPFLYIDAQNERVSYYDPETLKLRTPNWDYDEHELALAQVPKMYIEPESLRKLLSNISFYSALELNQRATIRLPQSLTPATTPGPNGESLYSTLYNLEASDSDAYRRIEEILKIGFPNFRQLRFPVVGAGQVTLAWYQKGLSKPFYPGQLSEGTLRFLWLVTVLLTPTGPSVLLLDEPEISLHPELLKLLAGILQDVAMSRQVFVATHSPELIRWLDPEQVLITEKSEEGASNYIWADSLDLERWLDDFTLRDLWLMGTIGGRP